jgi:D-alanyl-lipoteichoic acid acyltransferase DltB (MBOAT superfamily)
MLFNSVAFLFLFLPVTLLGYFLFNRKRLTLAANAWLLFASLFFYGWWNIRYLPLILASILFNYTVAGLMIDVERVKTPVSRRSLLIFGLVANLLFLGYFKYTNFFIGNVNALLSTRLPLLKIVLPLGISFFTITQIAFLVDCYEGLVEERKLLNYALFVTFFPHLLAGPILHHKEMMPQFDAPRNKVFNHKNFYLGACLFLAGLAKKVIIADRFAVWANAGFDSTVPLSLIEAWLASFSYTLQLYFDFSGYSDMAIGIGWLFNVQLPLNFNSPYKATSIIDFWKRWHMTLTNFITTYLYTPLLKSFGTITFRNSLIAIFIAMLISGFWHGAGWTFIVWGGVHGLALVVNHQWKKRKLKMRPGCGWLLTLLFVNVAFVFFRARNMAAAWMVVKGMCGLNGVVLGKSFGKIPFAAGLAGMGVRFGGLRQQHHGEYVAVVGGLLVVCWAWNSNEIVGRLKPSWKTSVAAVVVFVWTFMELSHVSEFLYFQF